MEEWGCLLVERVDRKEKRGSAKRMITSSKNEMERNGLDF
jgi:hypothetical protein